MLPQQAWRLSDRSEFNRDALVRFWLAAPLDQLQALWAAGFGEHTAALVRQLTAQTVFSSEQVALRNELNRRIEAEGLSQPLAHQLLLAVFLLSPAGLFKVANPEQQLPGWLSAAYKDLYEAPQTVMVLGQSPAAQPPAMAGLPNPDFGQFPASLAELVGNRIQLNRLLGLSNLYYIDPEDREISQELLQLRRSLARLILAAPPSELERLWSTDFGDRYWALVRSGVQAEPMNAEDQSLVDAATQTLNRGGFNLPDALNQLLVLMMYLKPGAMRVEAPEQKLPGWLLTPYRQIFEQVQPASV